MTASMTSRIFTFLGAVSLMLLGSACVSTTVVVDADDLSAADTTQTGVAVEGRGCGYQLFSIFPLGTNGRQWRAYEELRTNARGRVITDIQVEEYWIWGGAGNTYCTRMKAVAFPRLHVEESD